MNDYKFHIGDYRRDAGHLTVEEHGIYRTLLDELFLQETPLSTDIHYWGRKMRLTSDQKPILEQILKDYFDLTDDGYTHKRVSRELSRIYAVSAQAKANIDARWEAVRMKKAGNTPVVRPNNDGSTGDILPSNPETLLPSYPDISDANASSSKPTVSTGNGQVPIQQIITKWNAFANEQGLPLVVKPTTTIKGQIRQRWKDIPSLEQWDNFFEAIKVNDFLAGRAPPGMGRSKPFRSTLLWITKETNFAKIAAGEYD